MIAATGDSAREEALLARARRGDRTALESLLAPYLPRLQEFAARRLDPRVQVRESAEDVVQSACREVLVDLERFDGHGDGVAAFKNWLFRTTLRKIRDHERHHKRHKRDVARELQGTGDPVLDLVRSTGAPSRQLIGEEERQRVRAALDALPDHYREVLDLTYFEGLSAAQAAERLGESRTAVHSRLARALARLARLLDRPQV